MSDNSKKIDLIDIFRIIWKKKYFLISITAFFAICSTFYALSITNVYTSKVTLAPVTPEMNVPKNAMTPMRGFSGFSGFSLGYSNSDQINQGIETMKSLKFFSIMSQQTNLAVPLIAGTGWNRSQNKITVDERKYDELNKEWIRNAPAFRSRVPSDQEVYKVFKQKFKVTQDDDTGIITLSISYFSPYLAKEWLDIAVDTINQIARDDAINQAKSSKKYLEDQIRSTSLAEVKVVLSDLVQDQSQIIMLAESSPEYLFKVIDPAIVPELKSSPWRALICVVGTFFGFALGMLYVFLRAYYKES